MSLLRYYARAAANPGLIASVAMTLRAEWDPAGQYAAPDGTRAAEAHAATVLGMLATGGNTAGVKGYLRRAEEGALGTARSSSKQRGELADKIWRMMQDAAIQAAKESGVDAPAT